MCNGNITYIQRPNTIYMYIYIYIYVYISVAVEVLGVITRVGHRSCTRAGHHVRHTRSLRGRWAGYIRCECREFALGVLCKWPHTTGFVIVPVKVVVLMIRNKPSIL